MKPTINKIFCTLLLLFIAAGASYAQGPQAPGQVSGTLLDEQGKPMMYASASLLNAKDSTLVKGVISNEEGVYTFDHIKEGQYIVRASPVGYEKAVTKPFSIDKGSEAVTLPKIVMQPSVRTLSAVSITAAKPLVERKIDRTVVNVEGSVLAAGNSAMDILERAPGVEV
ncbi:MAG TPA: carboxypeptidase-like regulatory domain-containing protein, partial [Mucilaginibacter sp.]|nr:carboxypeptidase-like regulatory domain-containing protein [Mucilaginibacter sp.]